MPNRIGERGASPLIPEAVRWLSLLRSCSGLQLEMLRILKDRGPFTDIRLRQRMRLSTHELAVAFQWITRKGRREGFPDGTVVERTAQKKPLAHQWLFTPGPELVLRAIPQSPEAITREMAYIGARDRAFAEAPPPGFACAKTGL